MTAPVDVDLYYDFRSPYAYLTAHRIANGLFVAPRPVRWRWRPVSIDVLLNLQAGRRPLAAYADPLAPAKRRHLVADVGRMARFYQAPLRPPVPARPNPIPALGLATLLDADGAPHDGFRLAVFRALWEQRLDIADPSVLAEALGDLFGDLLDRAYEPAACDALVANSEAAYALGVFGVPSFVVAGEVFFGNDRLDLLGAHLTWGAAHR